MAYGPVTNTSSPGPDPVDGSLLEILNPGMCLADCYSCSQPRIKRDY